MYANDRRTQCYCEEILNLLRINYQPITFVVTFCQQTHLPLCNIFINEIFSGFVTMILFINSQTEVLSQYVRALK